MMQSSMEEIEYDDYDDEAFVLVDKEKDAVKFTKTPSPKLTSSVSPKSLSQSAGIKPFSPNSEFAVKLKFDNESIDCQQENEAKKYESNSFEEKANSENTIDAKINDTAWLIDFKSDTCLENGNVEIKECIHGLEIASSQSVNDKENLGMMKEFRKADVNKGVMVNQAVHEKENLGMMKAVDKGVMVDQKVSDIECDVIDVFETEHEREETRNIAQMPQEMKYGEEENIAGSEVDNIEINDLVIDDLVIDDLVIDDLVSTDIVPVASDIERIHEEEDWVDSFLEQVRKSSTSESQIENQVSHKECSKAKLSGRDISVHLKEDITRKQTQVNEKKSYSTNKKPKHALSGVNEIATFDRRENTRNFTKEELLNQRIMDIRKKNEERLKRVKEIEADKTNAELLKHKAISSSKDHQILRAVSGITNVRARGRGRGRGRGRAISQVNNDTNSPRRRVMGRGRGAMRSDNFKERMQNDNVFEDMALPVEKRQMTTKEKEEYCAWKAEREAIEEERLKRHKEAGGKWVREWDQEKIWDDRFRQWVPDASISKTRTWSFRGDEKN